ncbi:uncharacterized protein LOC115228381 [Octopus sinensis]|uniref:Uncharacterized protein LOC115228381 n=1 Tax=Octopus sinensis TaxID=2607531 RepID=A0A6P7TSW3_9MOLL|nr:uncharacterized protein LOC115228381 [Octopus sinensis]
MTDTVGDKKYPRIVENGNLLPPVDKLCNRVITDHKVLVFSYLKDVTIAEGLISEKETYITYCCFMSCHTTSNDDKFVPPNSRITVTRSPENKFKCQNMYERYDYSPNSYNYYYCEPGFETFSTHPETPHVTLPPLTSYLQQKSNKEVENCYNNPLSITQDYDYGNYVSYPDLNQFNNETFLSSYPATQENHVSTFVRSQLGLSKVCNDDSGSRIISHGPQGRRDLTVRSRSKQFPSNRNMDSSSSLDKSSPLDTFDNLINMKMKTFKHTSKLWP